jgi:hypothetical protein
VVAGFNRPELSLGALWNKKVCAERTVVIRLNANERPSGLQIPFSDLAALRALLSTHHRAAMSPLARQKSAIRRVDQ